MYISNFDEKLPDPPPGWNDRLYFYKYMTLSTAKIVLKNRTLRYSTSKFLNDPFDMQFNMGINSKEEEVKDIALGLLWRVYNGEIRPHPKNALGVLIAGLRSSLRKMSRENFFEEFSGAFDEGFQRMLFNLPKAQKDAFSIISRNKILCLTSRPNNTLMWAHYANNHTGIVLQFRSIPAFATPYGLARPVKYVSSIPELLSVEQLAGIFAGTASILDAGIVDRAIYTKFDAWSYEQEWRLSAGLGRDPDASFEDCPFGRNDLVGVIFGLRTSDQDQSETIELTRDYPNVSLMKVSQSSSNFDLHVKALS